MLQIAQSAEGPFIETDWVDRLVALGARAFRYASDATKLARSDQLFVAISVPVRDMAACLIAAGWMLTAPIPATPIDCRTGLEGLKPGSLIRLVTNHYVILDEFLDLDNNRVRIGARTFLFDAIKAVTVIGADFTPVPCAAALPKTPGFGPYMSRDDRWLQFLCQPPQGLAIVGAKTGVLSDLSVCVNTIGRPPSQTSLHEIVLPRQGAVATWATELISPGSLPDDPDESPSFKAVILDSASAIKAADLVDAPLLIAVVDRSVMDDAAAEFIVQRRNTRGDPVSPDADLGWQPPPGVEIVAFRTRR